ARAVDERTALVATSHVYFTSGAIQDIRAVAQAAHARGALCLIDAYQSVGQVPCDVRAADVDFLTAGGLKWLLGGPGIVFLYARAELARRLEPGIAGWFGHKRQFAFEPRVLERHDDARRFELGTPSLAAIYTQLGGLEYIEEIGVPAIRDVTAALTEDLIARACRRSVLRKGGRDRAHARRGRLPDHHRGWARHHGGGQPRLPGGERSVDRLQHRAPVRAGAQPIRRASDQFPVFLRAQDDVRE